MAETEVPTCTTFSDVYPEDALAAQRTRWNALLSSFEQTYSRRAEFVSRSPGRVNIIGEVGPPSRPLSEQTLTNKPAAHRLFAL